LSSRRKERVKELVSKQKPGAAQLPCVVRDAPSALLTMTYVIDGIEKLRHPEEAATRLSRRACPREGGGHTVPTQPSFNFFTRSEAGIYVGHGHRLEPDGVDGPLTASMCQSWVVSNANGREPSMSEVTTIGLDLAKTVFQVHGVDAEGTVMVRRSLRRAQVLAYFAKLPPCLVGMEACATAHYWAREIARLGHQVRLIPPAYAKAYVRRNKNDPADAAAICEAVSRPSMRFVAIKSEEQQAAAGIHKSLPLA